MKEQVPDNMAKDEHDNVQSHKSNNATYHHPIPTAYADTKRGLVYDGNQANRARGTTQLKEHLGPSDYSGSDVDSEDRDVDGRRKGDGKQSSNNKMRNVMRRSPLTNGMRTNKMV